MNRTIVTVPTLNTSLTHSEGRVAQLEERGVCNAEAWGSNPHASIRRRGESSRFKSAAANAPGNANYRGRIESHRLLEIMYRLLHLDVKWVSAETFLTSLKEKSVNSNYRFNLKTAQKRIPVTQYPFTANNTK